MKFVKYLSIFSVLSKINLINLLKDYNQIMFSKFLKDNGVVYELSCVNTLQQNEVAKRKNCHLLEVARAILLEVARAILLEVARAILFQMFVPNVHWGEVVLTATYLINRLPTWVLNGISPIKHMLSFFPSSPLMLSLPSHIFGCVTFVHSHNPHRGKLDPRAVKCVFIGYPSNKNGFKCYHPLSRESYLQVELVIESFPTQDVQVQVQEVMKLTLVLEQVQMSKPNVSIHDNSIEEKVQLSEPEVNIPDNSIKDVIDGMSIALRKGK
ncbi:hypothetical protein CR513_53685, partial [Mucuna pruriens]